MAERKIKQWITINGVHVPIYEGESKEDAVKRSISKAKENVKANEDQKAKDIAKNKVEKDKLNGKAVDEAKEGNVGKKFIENGKEYTITGTMKMGDKEYYTYNDSSNGKVKSLIEKSEGDELVKNYKAPSVNNINTSDAPSKTDDTLLEYKNSLSGVAGQKKVATLKQELRYQDRGIMTRSEFIQNTIKSGNDVEVYTVKGKEKYKATLNDKGHYIDITKTEYEYGQWLKNKNSSGSLSDASSGKAVDSVRIGKVPASFAANYPNLSLTELKKKYAEFLKKNRK